MVEGWSRPHSMVDTVLDLVEMIKKWLDLVNPAGIVGIATFSNPAPQ
jgi:hypothetical protein